MKLLSFIPYVILILFTIADAAELVKCIDASGNTLYTSAPPDGMQCFTEETEKETLNQNRSLRVNLMESCSGLMKRYDELEDRKKELSKRIVSLNKQLEDFSKACCQYPGTGDYESIQKENLRNRINSLKEEYSSFDERQDTICREIAAYRCDEIYSDMAAVLLNKSRRFGR